MLFVRKVGFQVCKDTLCLLVGFYVCAIRHEAYLLQNNWWQRLHKILLLGRGTTSLYVLIREHATF